MINVSRIRETALKFIARHILTDGDLGFLADEYMRFNNLDHLIILAEGNDNSETYGELRHYYYKKYYNKSKY